jgi:chemotaxis protein CheD
VFRHSISQFEQELVTIHPGEFFATGGDVIISTILGSCIAVGFFDEGSRMGGLNHFMLPGNSGKIDLLRSPDAKYGMYAMELLINDLMKLGARRGALKAKVFGGGSVLRFSSGASSSIPAGNVDFAFDYLRKEGIPVVASDVGGREPRKIFFYARTGKVLLKRIGAGVIVALAEKEEERYFESLDREKAREGEIVLFDAGKDKKG